MTAIAKWAALVPLFIIPFLPLYVANDLFFPFISSKGFAFRILVEIAFGAWMLLAIADKRYRPRFSWTLLIYGAFVAWMFLADLLAPNAHKAFWSNYERMDGWVTLVHVFLFFLVAGSVLSVGKLWKKWWMAFLGGSALIAGYGVLQLMGVFAIHQSGVRLDASFGNAAYFAAYLLSAIAIAVWQGMESRGWLRYVLYALAAVNTMLLFATATRGAILAFVGAAVLAALLFALQSKTGRKAGFVVLGGLGVVIAGFLLLKDAAFIQNDPTLSRIANISVADGGTRFTLWDMAWKGAMERPLTGWGQEGFNYVFAKHYEPSMFAQEPWFDRAHSVYVDWLVAGGFPALFLFIALMVSAVVGLYRSQASRSERIMLTVALAAYAFQAVFVFDNLLTYVVLAALLAIAHSERSRPIGVLERAPEDRSLVIAGPVILVATIAFVWIVNVPGIAGGQALIRGLSSSSGETALYEFKSALSSGTFATQEVREHFLTYASGLARRPDVADAVKQETMLLALSEMQKEVERVPNDPRLRVQFASGLESAGLMKEALAELDAAVALSPEKQLTIIQRAITKVRTGDLAGSRADFEAAYALDPSFDAVAAYLAGGMILTKDVAGARTFMMERFGTTSVDHPFLRSVFFETKMYSELLASAELAVKNAPGDPNALYLLAQSYTLTGRIDDARATLQMIIARFPQFAQNAQQILNSLPK